ncbi:MAG TPA: hypothetical protein VGZ51_01175 [Actinomycetota bacterium]|nr:hypothetical protein [Actinomycetota bacterium]
MLVVRLMLSRAVASVRLVRGARHRTGSRVVQLDGSLLNDLRSTAGLRGVFTMMISVLIVSHLVDS